MKSSKSFVKFSKLGFGSAKPFTARQARMVIIPAIFIFGVVLILVTGFGVSEVGFLE